MQKKKKQLSIEQEQLRTEMCIHDAKMCVNTMKRKNYSYAELLVKQREERRLTRGIAKIS